MEISKFQFDLQIARPWEKSKGVAALSISISHITLWPYQFIL